jgi:hypothetical protein
MEYVIPGLLFTVNNNVIARTTDEWFPCISIIIYQQLQKNYKIKQDSPWLESKFDCDYMSHIIAVGIK